MKNKKMIITLLVLVLVAAVVFVNYPKIKYTMVIRSLPTMNSEQYDEFFASGEEGVVYFSRITCPYCVENIDQINHLSKNTKVPIYYYNTENSDERTKEIRDSLGAEYVPSLFYIKDKKHVAIDAMADKDEMLKKLEDATQGK